MTRSSRLALACSLVIALAATSSANLLVDPGFEGGGGAAWNPYRSTTAFEFDFDNTDEVQDGLQSLRVDFSPMSSWQIFAAEQDITVLGGEDWYASVFAMTDISGAPAMQVYLETIFYSNSVEMVGMNLQSASLTEATPQDVWQQLSVAGTTPIGADSARYRLIIFNTGEAVTGSGSVWFDQAFAAVPEPATLSLLGLSSALLLLLRRKTRSH